MKNTITMIVGCVLTWSFPSRAMSQGLINNGAVISSSDSVHVTVLGAVHTTAYANGHIAFESSGLQLFVSGDWVNDNAGQAFALGAGATGTVILCGSNQLVGGTWYTRFPNLVIAGGGIKTLTHSVSVRDTMRMDSGRVELNGNSISFLPSGTLHNETASSYVFESGAGGTGGLLIGSQLLAAPVNAHVAGLGMSITSGQNLGVTYVSRGHVPRIGAGGYTSIARWYNMVPEHSLASVDSLRIAFFDHELNGQDKYTLDAWYSNDSGNLWQQQYATNYGLSNYVVADSGMLAGWWTLSSPLSNPLPVQLVDFSATCLPSHRAALVTWTTSAEANNSHFIIEKSTDLLSWLPVAHIAGAGNSNQTIQYSWTDSAASGGWYYRLSQVDFNGAVTVFDQAIAFVNCVTNGEFNLFPNPNDGEFVISYLELPDQTMAFQIHDVLGRMVHARTVSLSGEPASESFSLVLRSGTYFATCRASSVVITIPFVVQ